MTATDVRRIESEARRAVLTDQRVRSQETVVARLVARYLMQQQRLRG
jgi:hypothetical protein